MRRPIPFTSSIARLRPQVEAAGLRTSFGGATTSVSALLGSAGSLFSPSSSAHSSAASKYAGDHDGLDFSLPRLVSPTCSVRPGIAARLPQIACLSCRLNFLGMALLLFALEPEVNVVAAISVTSV
jgi:hypothetical protein